MDRKELEAEINRLNELYQSKDLEMRKAGASDDQRRKMLSMLNAKKESLMAEHGDDLSQLNSGKSKSLQNATLIGEGLDQSKLPDVAKEVNLNKQGNFARLAKQMGKKVAGVIPLAGVGMAALSGDPAMAAEELAGDIPVAGQIYEALKPSDTGNVSEEFQMLAEDEARKNYAKSPAGLAKIKAMLQKK